MGHVLLWGNAYAEVVRDGAGRVRELWPLRPDRTFPVRNSRNQLVYETSLENDKPRRLAAYRVLHIRGLSFDGLVGYSVISLGREALGMAMAGEEYGGRFFANDSRPGGYLEHPGNLSEEAQDRLRTQFETAHRGLGNAHRLAVLEEGMKWQQVGIPPKDAQFLEFRKFQTSEILRLFRMQPHKVGELDRATWGNIEHQAIEHVTDTIMPWLVRWEKAIQRTLLTESERQNYFVEYLVDGLLRGDYKTRQEGLAIQRQNGVINADEWRGLENMNPIEDGSGKVYLVNGNMLPSNRAGQQDEGEDDQSEDEE
jgi:HK97 family phage portal protein